MFEEEDDSFDIELNFIGRKPSLWQRFKGLFQREEEEEEHVEEEVLEEGYDRTREVAEAVLIGLSSAVWVHREFEKETPGMKQFLVTDVGIKHLDDGKYWLLVQISSCWDNVQPFYLPLHEFLETCYPIGDLTFQNHNA
jgi:hypothetical protein